MENNNFKKEVQQQLAGLHFQPSEKVWNGVEQQLKKEKRRRWVVLYWFLLAGLIISGGTITYISTSFKNKKTVTAKTESPKLKNKNTAVQNLENKKENNRLSSQTDFDNNADAAVVPLKNVDGINIVSLQKIIKANGKNKVVIKVPSVSEADEKTDVTVFNKKPDMPAKIKNAGNIAANEVQQDIAFKKYHPADSGVAVINKHDDINKQVTDSNAGNNVSVKENKKIKKTWLFSITAGLGISNIGNGFGLNIDGNQNKSYNNAAFNTNNSTQVSLPNMPAGFKKGMAFNFGIEAEKKINKQFSFVTGLSYNYLSASVLTGQNFDTAISISQDRIFYRQGFSQKYINKFHFISITAGIKANLFVKNNFSGNLTTGISIMQLITTNALGYDTSARVYYQNKNIFNKTLLAVNAGLQLKYKFKNRLAIVTGPQFMHTITPFSNSTDYAGKYFKVWALKAGISLNKKNKQHATVVK